MADLWRGVAPALIEDEWARGLAGFVKSELERGLDLASDRVFAPTLGEFKRLCRPCLDPEWAWYEAQEGLAQREKGERGDWTHPAVFFAASSMGMEVRSGDWMRHRTRWTRQLQQQLEKGWGRTIPDVPLQIDHQAKVGPPPAHVKSRLDRLMEESRAAAAAKREHKAKLDAAADKQLADRAAEDERLLQLARDHYAAGRARAGEGA